VGGTVVVGATVVGGAVVGSVVALTWLAVRIDPGESHCPEAAAPATTIMMIETGINRRRTG
jgi:hypothetical protein